MYPIEAAGAFRAWLDRVYIPEKFPKYLGGKVRKKTMTAAAAAGLLAAVQPARLEGRAETDEGNGDDESEDDIDSARRRSASLPRRTR